MFSVDAIAPGSLTEGAKESLKRRRERNSPKRHESRLADSQDCGCLRLFALSKKSSVVPPRARTVGKSRRGARASSPEANPTPHARTSPRVTVAMANGAAGASLPRNPPTASERSGRLLHFRRARDAFWTRKMTIPTHIADFALPAPSRPLPLDTLPRSLPRSRCAAPLFPRGAGRRQPRRPGELRRYLPRACGSGVAQVPRLARDGGGAPEHLARRRPAHGDPPSARVTRRRPPRERRRGLPRPGVPGRRADVPDGDRRDGAHVAGV